MKRTPLILLFSSALLLAACGGGGGGGGGIVPTGGGPSTAPATATPSPTPSPSPTPTATPAGGSTALTGPTTYAGLWGPPGVAQALDFPVQHGYDGAGQGIAVVIDSDVKTADINTFLSYFKIPSTSRAITPVYVDNAVAGNYSSSLDEAELDTETVAGLAPGANIYVYEVPSINKDQYLVDAYNQIISDKKAFIVNSSFGGCEYSGSTIDPVLKAGAADGIAFTFSAGDDGNVCDTTTTPVTVGANYPASNPYAIGVGGTETNTSNGDPLTNPVVWNDTSCQGGQCAGGGGVSGIYSLPSYQQGLAGETSATMRNTPDISMPAEDAAIYISNKWSDLLGTSWSAPQAAALLAEVYQYCGANGGPIPGVTDPASIPYYVFSKDAKAFIDVTGGNDQYGSTTPFYTAKAGYDDASGIGVPLGYALAQTACPNHVPASGLIARATMSRMTAGAGTVRPAQAFTMSVTPRIPGLVDQGVRAASAPTRIQIALDPSSNVVAGEAAVVTALQSAGFTIVRRFPNHLVVDAVAPSAAVGRFFRTQMHDVLQGRYGTRYLAATQIVVPASIAPYVGGVSLDDLAVMHLPRG